MNPGWWNRPSPSSRLDPSTRQTRSAAPVESRNVTRQGGRAGRAFGEPPQLEQAQVGIGRGRQPVEDDREQFLEHA